MVDASSGNSLAIGSLPIRVVLVYHESCASERLAETLESQGGFELLGEYSVRHTNPFSMFREADVVLVDGHAGTDRVLDLTGDIRRAGQAKIVILAVEECAEAVAGLVDAGVKCYLSGNASEIEIATVFRLAARGESCCPPKLAFEMFERLSKESQRTAAAQPATSAPLTAREVEILRMLGDRLDNEQIAAFLFLSVPTVKNHVHRILAKLRLRTRHEAAAYWSTYASAGIDPL